MSSGWGYPHSRATRWAARLAGRAPLPPAVPPAGARLASQRPLAPQRLARRAVPPPPPLPRRRARVGRPGGRCLPNGWLDPTRRLILSAGAYSLYRLVRGFVDGEAGLAFENARTLVGVERSLGLFFEP